MVLCAISCAAGRRMMLGRFGTVGACGAQLEILLFANFPASVSTSSEHTLLSSGACADE